MYKHISINSILSQKIESVIDTDTMMANIIIRGYPSIDDLNDGFLMNIFNRMPAWRVLIAVCSRWHKLILSYGDAIRYADWYHAWVHGHKRAFAREEILEILNYNYLSCVRIYNINIDDHIHELDVVRGEHILLIRDFEHVFISVILLGSQSCLLSFMTEVAEHFNKLSVWGMGAKYIMLLRRMRVYAILIAEYDAPNTQPNERIAAEITGNELRDYAALSSAQQKQSVLRDGKIALIAALILHKCIPEQIRFSNTLWRHINTWLQRQNMVKIAPIYDVEYFAWCANPRRL
jgi:hypothetical protein